ncbi:SMI1/KNR4 family protein [Thermopolyspora flexuosa]|uniref:SMI1/KNR4 family protein SUKH-1 n=1 Tax=Thermopolyspora flexuosa TaxID=103836 RepID=A0A543IWW2_9ACTN|nr:SMI1/KNR4 family protein [Thermopolyspora flexuosa]TQM75065.1 SMI1/KNR4 family protein SUKH-1 [Thermopolyspora flexuosa]
MSTRNERSELSPASHQVAGDADRSALNADSGLPPPATEAEIARHEARLGTELPPSYRRFLLSSNGLGNDEEDSRLLGIEEVGWLRDIDPSVAESWSEPRSGDSWSVPDELYFVYGPEQDPIHLRREYVSDTLLIGYWDDGVVLLNPHVKTPEGEWEAWHLAPWLPGATRYRSFQELIEDRLGGRS